MTSQSLIETAIRDGTALHQRLLDEFVPLTNQVADMCLQTFERGGRVFFAENIAAHPAFQHYEHRVVGGLPESNHIMKNGFTFGNHHAVNHQAREYISRTIRDFIAERGLS